MGKRSVKPNRQQLVVVIADNSGSMRGKKAEAAVEGVQNMIVECQTRLGNEQSQYRILLILFGNEATVHPLCQKTPVLRIDTKQISFTGDGGGTNLRAALELAHSQVADYLREIENHSDKSKHPLPLVILFSDGHNGDNFGRPEPAAKKLKELKYDGEEILIVTAGVDVDPSDTPDVATLKAIASSTEGIPLYVSIRKAEVLSSFLAAAGSSAASTAADLYKVIRDYIEE